jgi:hypothetical protein
MVYSLGDLPPIDKDDTCQKIDELKQPITHAKNEWRHSGGHVILEQSFDIDLNGNRRFENLQFEKQDHPFVIKAKDIGKQTMKGRGSLSFNRLKNLWLYGINFAYETEREDEDDIEVEDDETHDRYARVKNSSFEKNVIIIDREERNNHDKIIVCWGLSWRQER